MATGKRAFQRGRARETLAAIIRDEPEPVAQVNPRAPAPLRWIVERCLAKDPDERYASTRDLARDLKSVREHIGEVTSHGVRRRGVVEPARAPLVGAVCRSRLWRRLAGVSAGSSSAGGRLRRSRRPSSGSRSSAAPSVRALRAGRPDGPLHGGVGREPIEIFSSGPRARSPRLRLSGGECSPISLGRDGDSRRAASTDRRLLAAPARSRGCRSPGAARRGDPARTSTGPIGRRAARARRRARRRPAKTGWSIPIGKVLYETAGWIENPRFSPDGRRIAFIDHSWRRRRRSRRASSIAAGKKKTLAAGLRHAPGARVVARRRRDLVHGGASRWQPVALRRDASGKLRLLARVTGTLVAPRRLRPGACSWRTTSARSRSSASVPGSEPERTLAGSTSPARGDLGRRQARFSSTSRARAAARATPCSSGRRTAPRRCGSATGSAMALSPDGKWALAVVSRRRIRSSSSTRQAPASRRSSRATVWTCCVADWLPDRKRILSTASETGHGAPLRPGRGRREAARDQPEGYVTFQGTSLPDGKRVAVRGPDQRRYLYPLDGGEPAPIPASQPEETPYGWSGDGRSSTSRIGASAAQDRPGRGRDRPDASAGRSSPARLRRRRVGRGHSRHAGRPLLRVHVSARRCRTSIWSRA